MTAELVRRGYGESGDRGCCGAAISSACCASPRTPRSEARCACRMARRCRASARAPGTWASGGGANGAQEVAALRLGHRARHDADRHGRDVWRRRRRGGGRRGDRRASATRVFLVSKVYPHNASRRGRAGRLRAQPASGCGPTGSTSICCTGAAACRSPRRWRRSSGCARPARSATGACRTSTPTTWRSSGAARRRRMRREPGALQPRRARHRVRPAALVRARTACR